MTPPTGTTHVYLVRHAHAGSRQRWDGPDDSLRPLTERGRREAEIIGSRLAAQIASRTADGTPAPLVTSSPYVRCMQTLEPLARLLDRSVTADDRLAEAGPFEPMLDLVLHAPDGSVLCSHGDMIPEVIDALHRRGCTIDGEPHWEKGSVWTLERHETRVVRASATPPPET